MITPPTSTDGAVDNHIYELRRLFEDNQAIAEQKRESLVVISQKLSELRARNYEDDFTQLHHQLAGLLAEIDGFDALSAAKANGGILETKFQELKVLAGDLEHLLPRNDRVDKRWEDLMLLIERGSKGYVELTR